MKTSVEPKDLQLNNSSILLIPFLLFLECLVGLLEYAYILEYDSQPDYEYCITYLLQILQNRGEEFDMKMDWSNVNDQWKATLTNRIFNS